MSNKTGKRAGRPGADIKPKILLKPEHQPNAAPPTPPIYIASQQFVNRSLAPAQNVHKGSPSNSLTIATNPEPHHTTTTAASKEWKASIELLGPNHISVNPDLADHLHHDNQHFRVIAVLGRGAEKTKILNLFTAHKPDVFSPDTRGVQMVVTKERQIILNVNLHNYHKTKIGRESEMELLMLYITFLKVCDSLIILEPEMEARNSLRLLRLAEIMEFGERLGLNPDFIPNIIFLTSGWKKTSTEMVRSVFKGSRLQDNVHLLHGGQHEDVIKLAYRYPRVPMSLQTTATFTELNWYQALQSLWKQHKTNYFIMKYVKGSAATQ